MVSGHGLELFVDKRSIEHTDVDVYCACTNRNIITIFFDIAEICTTAITAMDGRCQIVPSVVFVQRTKKQKTSKKIMESRVTQPGFTPGIKLSQLLRV